MAFFGTIYVALWKNKIQKHTLSMRANENNEKLVLKRRGPVWKAEVEVELIAASKVPEKSKQSRNWKITEFLN